MDSDELLELVRKLIGLPAETNSLEFKEMIRALLGLKALDSANHNGARKLRSLYLASTSNLIAV